MLILVFGLISTDTKTEKELIYVVSEIGVTGKDAPIQEQNIAFHFIAESFCDSSFLANSSHQKFYRLCKLIQPTPSFNL